MDIDPRENLPPGMRAVAEVVVDEALALITRTCLWAVQCFNTTDVRDPSFPQMCEMQHLLPPPPPTYV